MMRWQDSSNRIQYERSKRIKVYEKKLHLEVWSRQGAEIKVKRRVRCDAVSQG